MSRGSRYSDEDRREAVQEYLVCGALAMVGEVTGIPRKTLSDWHRSEWWDQLTAELRQEDGEAELSGERGEVTETKPGRPTSYKPDYAEQAMRLCLLGATDKDLAASLGVAESTIDNWKGAHPEFLGAIRQGKIEADSRVAQSLYHRATGYSHPDEKIMQHKGEVVRVPTTKHYPPDTQAMGLWLKNRRPNEWRETTRIRVENTQDSRLIAQLSPELTEKLAKAAGESLDFQVIEGEYTPVDE